MDNQGTRIMKAILEFCLCVCVCVCMYAQSCLTLFWPYGLWPARLLYPWDFPGKNTEVGCHFLLQEIFPIQRLNPCLLHLLHWQADSLLLAPPGKLLILPAAAAAAKSFQSCPTLCDPRDSSPPGFPVPGILQARTLEWVAISFSNVWKWKVKVKSLSHPDS